MIPLIFITLNSMAIFLMIMGYKNYKALKLHEAENENIKDAMSLSILEIIFGKYECLKVQGLQKKVIKKYTFGILLVLASMSLLKKIN